MCRLTELLKRSLQDKRIDWVLSLHPSHATASTEKVRPLHEALVRDFLCSSAAEATDVGRLPSRSAADDQKAYRRRDMFSIVAANSSLCICAHVKLVEISLKFAKVSLAFDACEKKPVLVVADAFCRENITLMSKDEVSPNDVWAFLVNGDMKTAREVLSWFVAEGAFSNDLYDHYNFNLSGLETAFRQPCVIRRDLCSSCVLIEDNLGIEHHGVGMTTPCRMCSVHVDHPQTMCDYACRGGRKLTFLSGESSSVEALIRHEVSLILDIGEHPNIAKFYGAFDVSHSENCSAMGGDVRWALLTESCQVNLLESVRKTPYVEYECVQLAKSLLGALQHVHSAGIVHRRVQPSNVQVWPCGRFVLEGFHQAVRVSEGKELARTCCQASYRAPEVFQGREDDCDSKMDMFAFGLVLYFATSGVEPLSNDFSSQELVIKLAKILHAAEPQEASKNSDLACQNRLLSETSTHDALQFKLDFSCSRTKILSRQLQELLLMTTHMKPSRRPTAEDALTCEWLGGDGSLFSGDADAIDEELRNKPSISRILKRASSTKVANRPQTPPSPSGSQTPPSPSGSAMKAIRELRKEADSEPPLFPRTIVFDNSLMPVAPCGRPASRFEGRRGGVLAFNLSRHRRQ
eukprot:TRINITY_DN6561_c0_g5_i1.p1 TRINITY_DN6561_c0_g5~~TRINITY_DN6561_c0_g5_i1.p1  ORF type:complete len:633 (+),score=46.11 TRINITY_DN6561_c0_g5_i1:83-1981(+)